MSLLLSQTIEQYFKTDEILNQQIFDQLLLYVYSLNSDQNDLYLLAKLLDSDSLHKVIGYYDGDIIKLPSREEYKTNMLTALCFWLKVFKGYSWIEIKEYLKIPDNNKDLLSSISIGGKINKLKDTLGVDLISILEKTEESEFVNFYNKLKGI